VRIATVDVGTNSLLLLVADLAADGQLRVVEDRCRIEGLGRGVDRSGELDEGAIARGLDAIREYAHVVQGAQVDRLAAVGTQALREAKNGARFLEPAAALLGTPIEVIEGRREAELAFQAVVRSFPELAGGPLLVCDVGGGSTELIAGRGGVVESLVSLPIGSVRMTERFLASDPPAPEEVRALYAALDDALSHPPLPRGVPLVGTAGTVTTLAAVAQGLEPYTPERVQGMRLARGEIERQLGRYLAVSLAGRRRIPGLEPKRADTIIAGAAIVDRVMARAGVEDLVVSDRGIRWGLAYELAAKA
jgi:exopolyphosphatase / guanosine-5'-triphosphate,3'-diphosphate pyrophosphatase